MMSAYLILIAALFVGINLTVDLLYLVIDPRLRGRSELEAGLMAVRAHVSPIFCCGRRSARGDRAYSLDPLQRSVDYAFSVSRSVRPVTAAFRRPRYEDR